MTIIAQLSSDTIASAGDIAVHTGSPVLALCRKLLAAGYPSSSPLEAYRGDTLSLKVRSIGEAAGLRVVDAGFQGATEADPAPPMRSTALAAARHRAYVFSATLPSSAAAL